MASNNSTNNYTPSTVPIGCIFPYTAATAPTGYLLCDGSSLLRAGTYAGLFAIIGTTYGYADGSHFTLPDLKGKVITGFNAAETEFDAMGEAGGAKTVTLDATTMPTHTHVQNAHTHTQDAHGHRFRYATTGGSTTDGGNSTGTNWKAAGTWIEDTTATNQNTTPTNQNTGSGNAHANLVPYITLQYIIKY
jgi:microcystin-dependent protein